jgi:hypothetical protein
MLCLLFLKTNLDNQNYIFPLDVTLSLRPTRVGSDSFKFEILNQEPSRIGTPSACKHFQSKDDLKALFLGSGNSSLV